MPRIDVTLPGHDRWTRVGFACFLLLHVLDDRDELCFLEARIHHIEFEFVGNFLADFDVDPLVDGDHDAHRHQLALDHRCLDAGLFREFADADLARHAYDALLLAGRRRTHGTRKGVASLAAGVLDRPGRHDRHASRRTTASGDLSTELLLLPQVDDFTHALALLEPLRGHAETGAWRGGIEQNIAFKA